VSRVRRAPRLTAVVLGAITIAVVLATRLPFLPATLEDIDSVNFDLGVHEFDPYGHRPHPPGYAVYIAAAKLVHPFFDSHAAGLAVLSAFFAALATLPLFALLAPLTGRRAAALATLAVVFNPAFWLNSVRPMSDVTGFAGIVGAQALLVAAWRRQDGDRWRWCAAAALAGLAIGVRLQAVLLVGPLLAAGMLRRRDVRLPIAASFAAAVATWLVPTIVSSGGPARFFAKQLEVIGEALPSEPLVADPSIVRVVRSAVDVFFTPWNSMAIGSTLLILAGAGAIVLVRRDRRALGMLALLFLPYLLYHGLLQSTETIRYVIPALPLIAALAAVAVERACRARVLPMVAVAAAGLVIATRVTMPALRAYTNTPSPPIEAVRYLRNIARTMPSAVVAGHYIFSRYLPALEPDARVIRTQAKEEWRALNRYWVSGGRRPVWFLRDPDRSMLNLSDSERVAVATWQWPEPAARLLKGARPSKIQLVRLEPPDWFAESGFLLSGDAGPVDQVAQEPHILFVRTSAEPRRLVVSGTTEARADVSIDVAGDEQARCTVTDSFTIQTVVAPSDGADAYTPVQFETDAPLRLTDVQLVDDDRDAIQLLDGFQAAERDDHDLPFRWIAPDARLTVVRSGEPVRIALHGRVPTDYLRLPLTVRITIDDLPPVIRRIDTPDFTTTLDLPRTAAGTTTAIAIAVPDSFVPDEIEGNGDRRRLAIRIYGVETVPTAGRPN
jgi:hypothetical protein